jgi:hypothetical protein
MMIACVSPSLVYSLISLSTLNYAQVFFVHICFFCVVFIKDVQNIKNSPVRRVGAEEVEMEELKEMFKRNFIFCFIICH